MSNYKHWYRGFWASVWAFGLGSLDFGLGSLGLGLWSWVFGLGSLVLGFWFCVLLFAFGTSIFKTEIWKNLESGILSFDFGLWTLDLGLITRP